MILRDPVHGLISFQGSRARLITRLLDTREVQRLRRIRALGLASLAFPGAEHSRFAHAVGCAHVMTRYLARVAELSDQLPARERVDEDTANMAVAAALLHDVGHGPWSHSFEEIVADGRAHEQWSSQIILDPDTEVHQVLTEFDRQMPARVERLIHGECDIPHLAKAVSGTFDVDRCDYLMRDSHMTGVGYGRIDLDWLLASLRLHLPDSGAGPVRAMLAVDGEKGLTAVEDFFRARLYMYRQVYLHKAVRAGEVMLEQLFARLRALGPDDRAGFACLPESLFARAARGHALSTSDYLELDDHGLERLLQTLSASSDPVVARLAGGLTRRRLLKTFPLRVDVDSEIVRERLAELASDELSAEYLVAVDRVGVEFYSEDSALVVVEGHAAEHRPLLAASHVLRALSRESFELHRAVFPLELRDRVKGALREFA